MIDRYVQSPPQGWPDWCEAEIRNADFVLMVCTETYLRRVNGEKEFGRGHGVRWEGRLSNQHLYDAGSATRKFVPVLLADGSPDHIPTPVKGATIYWVEIPESYEALLRLLTDQPLTPMPPLGRPRQLPPRQRLTEAARGQPLQSVASPHALKAEGRLTELETPATNAQTSRTVQARGLAMQQHVFISYRHESLEHARAVRRLAELLRQANIPVALDQFYVDEFPAGPDLGWPKWCEDHANESVCVLIIASEGWFSAYEKTGQPGVGLGAASEADLFRQLLYDGAGDNPRIRLAFLHDIPAQQVPVRLRPWHRFHPFENDDQLNRLVRWVAGRVGLSNVELPTVRWPEPMEFRPNLADRLKEWPAVVDLLAGRSRERILLFEGPSGLGKSALVRETTVYAKRLRIPVVQLDLKGGGLDVEDILGQFYLDLGQSLPDFSRERRSTVLLRKDLRGLRQPVLVVFDTYEGCIGNKPVVDWLDQQFFPEVETALGLAVILAGQQVPDAKGTRWREWARHFDIEPIFEKEQWELWVELNHPDFKEKGIDLNTLIRATEGKPSLMSNFCETISKSPN